MHPFPHRYVAQASGRPEGSLEVSSPGLPDLVVAPPVEFDGPGDQWSPESLLASAVAGCLVLTFRAIAQASKMEWTSLRCEADAKLDRADRVTRFTEIRIRARLELPAGVDLALGRRLLEKAEKACLVTSSLRAESTLEADVVTAGPPAPAEG